MKPAGMEFTVSRAELLRELGLIQGIVSKESTIPILANVLIEAGGDRIRLTSTDLEIGIRCSCPARVKHDGAGTIPAKRLLDYVRLLPDADICVTSQANHWMSLVCGASKARIAGMGKDSFPELPAAGERLAEIPLGALAHMISKTDFAVSRESSRFTIDGALLLIEEGQVHLVATDGHRLSVVRQEIEGGGDRCRVILPRKAMLQLEKLAGDGDHASVVAFSRVENHLMFEVEGRTLICRELVGTFPDYERALPKDQPHSVGISREQLRAAIARVALFSDERSRLVRLAVTKGLITLRGACEAGDSEEEIISDGAGDSLEIGFNAAYLLQFLNSISDDQVQFLFNNPQFAGEFRPAGAKPEDHRYVVMPMRV